MQTPAGQTNLDFETFLDDNGIEQDNAAPTWQ